MYLFICPAIQDFAMMANHIRPDAAAEEMDNLTAVYTAVQRHWHLNVNTHDRMLLLDKGRS